MTAKRRLFWLLNDLLYAVTFGRVDLDSCRTVKAAVVERLRGSADDR